MKTTKKLDTATFIIRSKKIHNNIYDYSLVDYVNYKNKVKILCLKHGLFEQTPNNHLNGHGCNECALEIKGFKQRLSNNEFINRAINVHGNRYDYSLIKYKNTHKKIKIICNIHEVFMQHPSHHLNGHGCPLCSESKGEKIIREFLEENNINFNSQYKFNDCINILPLPFDFYLPNYNICIEFDGIQHFKPKKYFGGVKGLEKRKYLDEIKTNYCKAKEIKLIRIRYNENINNKLKNNLK